MVKFRPLNKAPPPSSRGLGRSPLKAKTGVRVPVGAHAQKRPMTVVFDLVESLRDSVPEDNMDRLYVWVYFRLIMGFRKKIKG